MGFTCLSPTAETPQEKLLEMAQKLGILNQAQGPPIQIRTYDRDGLCGEAFFTPGVDLSFFSVADPVALGEALACTIQAASAIQWKRGCSTVQLRSWTDEYRHLHEHYPSFVRIFERVTTYREVMLTPAAEETALDVKRYTLEKCKALKRRGLVDAALVESARIAAELRQDLPKTNQNGVSDLDSVAAATEWECIKAFWDLGQSRRALYLARALGARLTSLLVSQQHEPSADRAMLESIVASIGRWMFESQWESLESVEAQYFNPLFVHRLDRHQHDLTSRAPPQRVERAEVHLEPHRIYAEVLDGVIQAQMEYAYSKEAAAAASVIRSSEEELALTRQEIQKQTALTNRKKPSDSSMAQGLQQEAQRLCTVIEQAKQAETRRFNRLLELTVKALRHYCTCLKFASRSHGNGDFVKAACRVLSLWFYWGTKAPENSQGQFFADVLSAQDKGGFHVGFLHHLRIFAYQLAARVNHDNKESFFQLTLTAMLRGLMAVFPTDCVFPLIQLKNGARIPSDHKGYDRFAFQPTKVHGAREVLETVCAQEHGLIRGIVEASDLLSDFFIQVANMKVPDGVKTIKLSPMEHYRVALAAAKILPAPTADTPVPALQLRPTTDSVTSSNTTRARRTEMRETPDDVRLLFQKTLGVPTVASFEDTVTVTETGISRPKIVAYWDTAGVQHQCVVKGRDDLRQDAVMEQLFGILNTVRGIPTLRSRRFE